VCVQCLCAYIKSPLLLDDMDFFFLQFYNDHSFHSWQKKVCLAESDRITVSNKIYFKEYKCSCFYSHKNKDLKKEKKKKRKEAFTNSFCLLSHLTRAQSQPETPTD